MMYFKFLGVVAVAMVVAGVSTTAVAYGKHGHGAFCQAAYELAEPQTQQHIDALVAKHSSYTDFGGFCSWADDIKSDKTWDWAKPHHYVNFSRSAAKVTNQDCPVQGGCVLSAIQHYYNVLKHDRDDWQALAFLAHFIGDLHQPMHVSFADDLGGNRARLTYFGQPTNLHRLWDTDMLLRRGGEDTSAKAKQLIDGLSVEAALSVTPEQTLKWANESAAITRRIYSNYREGQELGEDYTAQWEPVLEQRMQQGAERLAAILDGLFSDAAKAKN